MYTHLINCCTSHPKVRDLELFSISYQNIPAGQVTMYYTKTRQILLKRERDQTKWLSGYVQWL